MASWQLAPGATGGISSNVATAVIMSMTATAPFSKGDSDIAVAYLSAFILVSFVTLFPLGGYKLIAKDYADGAMPAHTDDDDVRESAVSRMRRRWNVVQTMIHTKSLRITSDSNLGKTTLGLDQPVVSGNDIEMGSPEPLRSRLHVSFGPSEPTARGAGGSTKPPASTGASQEPTIPDNSPPVGEPQNEPRMMLSRLKRALYSIKSFAMTLASPPTIAMAAGFVVALVPQLKALFIAPTTGSNVYISPAPDGLPPLNFVIDTANFIGGGSIPLGLVCLGSALARLQVPKPFGSAPLGAIMSFSILKYLASL
ncbi:auxin efflux carrier transmembrane protein [Ceratobasidium sp. AG-Ba]|nr:auxin efflux carrier transmembrane protein [Ceratobasidium sp. AG-Ba]QRV91775.1 auxin efflux carrier transmembrane protein [Ceratobasidium sp. AG-Ba]